MTNIIFNFTLCWSSVFGVNCSQPWTVDMRESAGNARCIPLSNCPIVRTHSLLTCGYNEREIQIWCPMARKPKAKFGSMQKHRSNLGIIAEKKCDAYQRLNFGIQERQFSPIVNGKKALPKEFPHMALIGANFEKTVRWFCGGSLISEQYVLTAAHCKSHPKFGNARVVRLGDLNYTSTTDDAAPEQFGIANFLVHPTYKSPQIYNDIALIQLDRPVKFSSYIKPICLDTNSILSPKVSPVATGWGRTSLVGAVSTHLLKVRLDYFSIRECRLYYKTKSELPYGIMDDTQLCYGGKTGQSDTCLGDSGGPLQIQFGRTFKQVGVTSFGSGCGKVNVPAVYTKVSAYIPWIERIVWSNKINHF